MQATIFVHGLGPGLPISPERWSLSSPCPPGLTFACWGCCGLGPWRKPTKLAHSCLLSFCICLYGHFKAISAVFHSISSPDNSPLSHSVLPVLFLPYRSFPISFLYFFIKSGIDKSTEGSMVPASTGLIKWFLYLYLIFKGEYNAL